MSVRELLQAAAVAALSGNAGIDLAGVFDAPPVRAVFPYAVVDEPVLADWSTKDLAGREARLAVLVRDGGERPVRLRGLLGDVEAAVEAMGRALGAGWRVASLTPVRSRIQRERDGTWLGVSEYRVRMLRES